MATSTKKTASKRSTTTKTTAASTAKKPAAKKSATKKAATKSTAAKSSSTSAKASTKSTKRPPLRDREPIVVLEDAGYAVTGVLGDVIDLAKDLPSRAEGFWRQFESTAKDTPKRIKELRTEAPSRFESQLTELRERVAKDSDRFLSSFEKAFDSKAAEGRKLADQVKQDERIATLLERTTTSRSQVKAAVTSATKTADVAFDAGKKQLDVARSQAKGAVTSASKTAEKAREASAGQAKNTKSQAKAAATSVKKSADEIVESAS